MDLSQFVEKVSVMRNAQKSYFRTRAIVFLDQARKLEREVDKAIEQFYNPQGDLLEGVRE